MLVDVMQVFTVWDVVVMSRVEEHSMQSNSSAPPYLIPLPLELADAEPFDVNVDLGEVKAGPAHRSSGRHIRTATVP
jgi:hypothetical protein